MKCWSKKFLIAALLLFSSTETLHGQVDEFTMESEAARLILGSCPMLTGASAVDYCTRNAQLLEGIIQLESPRAQIAFSVSEIKLLYESVKEKDEQNVALLDKLDGILKECESLESRMAQAAGSFLEAAYQFDQEGAEAALAQADYLSGLAVNLLHKAQTTAEMDIQILEQEAGFGASNDYEETYQIEPVDP